MAAAVGVVVEEEDSAVDMVEEAAEVTGVEVTAGVVEDMEEEDMVAVIMEDEGAVATEQEEDSPEAEVVDMVEEEDSEVIVEVRKI